MAEGLGDVAVMHGQLTLVAGNNRVSVYNADPWTRWILDQELRYPTAVAQARESGWQPANEDPGAWDGWVRLFHQPKTLPAWFPAGLLVMVERLFQKMRIHYQLEDARQRPDEGVPEWPNMPLADRDYQQAAIQKAIDEGRGVIDMPPRSGKTATGMAIVGKLGLPTIWIAPTDGIIRQTLTQFQKFFGDNFAYHQVGLSGIETSSKRQVVLATYATAIGLPPTFWNTREVLFTDEWHHAGSKTHREISKCCEHIYYRFGMTGTFFRSGDDTMAMHALLSNTIYKVTSKELLDRGYLVPTNVIYIPVEAPRLRCPGDDSRVAPWLKYGVQEHNIRNQLVAYCAAYLSRIGRKVLVLVSTKIQGRLLAGMIESQLPERAPTHYKAVEFVSTDRKRNTQQEIIKAFNESTEVQVLLGTSLIGEGIDLPPADALVYARGEKAEVALTQNVYRVCTAWEGKRDAIIVDFADRHNKFLMNHSMQRLETFYKDPVFDVEVLPSVKFFGSRCREYQARALDSMSS